MRLALRAWVALISMGLMGQASVAQERAQIAVLESYSVQHPVVRLRDVIAQPEALSPELLKLTEKVAVFRSAGSALQASITLDAATLNQRARLQVPFLGQFEFTNAHASLRLNTQALKRDPQLNIGSRVPAITPPSLRCYELISPVRMGDPIIRADLGVAACPADARSGSDMIRFDPDTRTLRAAQDLDVGTPLPALSFVHVAHHRDQDSALLSTMLGAVKVQQAVNVVGASAGSRVAVRRASDNATFTAQLIPAQGLIPKGVFIEK